MASFPTMDAARWQQIERLARPAAGRAAFLAEACAGNDGLRQEVQALLDAPVTAEGFLKAPAAAEHAIGGVLDGDSPILTGRRLGIYQVHERVGAGGMGEVYRARDTRLGRDVAIKILPAAFTADPDRLARFEREARVLAALNHPNIATIHGIEDGPPDAGHGVRGLVMELVEGETLAERIARSHVERALPGSLRGPDKVRATGIPVKEALHIATQIADALDAAHEKGIVHRDLKPANIKVTPAGTVKVLDFGLAKAVAGDQLDSQAPTVTIGGTREGVIVGTAAYMSPEQARGLAVDKRTDIWAYGCVLYEMLTGRSAFARSSIADTLAAIVEREPDWSALGPTTPATVTRLMQRCLQKDLKLRLRDIGDARLEIGHALDEIRGVSQRPSAMRSRSMAVGAATALVLSGVIALLLWPSRQPSSSPVEPPLQLTDINDSALAPSLSRPMAGC